MTELAFSWLVRVVTSSLRSSLPLAIFYLNRKYGTDGSSWSRNNQMRRDMLIKFNWWCFFLFCFSNIFHAIDIHNILIQRANMDEELLFNKSTKRDGPSSIFIIIFFDIHNILIQKANMDEELLVDKSTKWDGTSSLERLHPIPDSYTFPPW